MSRSFKGRAEIVYVGDGTSDSDYPGVDVKGKIVLARGAAGKIHELAVLQRGAIGVICFGPILLQSAQRPGVSQYGGLGRSSRRSRTRRASRNLLFPFPWKRLTFCLTC